MESSKQTCVGCHFLAMDRLHHPNEVPHAERDKILVNGNDWSWCKDYHSLGCHMGVWDEGYGSAKQDRKKIIVDTDRRDFCFFWPFKAGMFFPAGKTLQKREWELRQASHDRRLTIWGLWIASIALVVNAVLTLAGMVLPLFTRGCP